MKKCLYCGAKIADDSLFCTECGKEQKGILCPHCGAVVNEGDVYCTECGKRINEIPSTTTPESIKPKCPHCGAVVNEGDVFCTECGKSINVVQTENTEGKKVMKECIDSAKYVIDVNFEDVKETAQTEEKEEVPQYNFEVEEEPKTWRNYKFPIFAGIFIILFLVICWWRLDSSNKRLEKEESIAAREAFVKDSLRKDSIKLEEQKKQERIEAEKVDRFRRSFTFTNFLDLMSKYDKLVIAQKCGLDFVYKENKIDGEIECKEYVYGFDVEKGNKKEWGYDIIAKSTHSCYIRYYIFSSTDVNLYFKDYSDAEFFQKQAKEYGLLVNENTMFVPKKKMSSGYHYVESLDWGGEYEPIYMIGRTESENDWYKISIGVDF